jgi:hypothetical protein
MAPWAEVKSIEKDFERVIDEPDTPYELHLERFRQVGADSQLITGTFKSGKELTTNANCFAEGTRFTVSYYFLFSTLSIVLLFSLFSSSIVIPLAKIIVLLLSSVPPLVKIAA